MTVHIHCSRCRTSKPEADYYRSKDRNTGRQAYCKTCSRSHNTAYVQATRARKKNQQPDNNVTTDGQANE